MMKFTHNLASIAALSVVTILGHVGSAQAFTFNMTKGINGPGGVTNQGAFSDYSGNSNVQTINFNSGVLPTTGFATYSFQNTSGNSGFRADKYAPAGPNAEVNTSQYVKVSGGDRLEIKLTSTANYFGMDWGAISKGNTLSFYRGNSLITSYKTTDVNPIAPTKLNGEGNGYGHFFADNANERFDRIVLTQLDTTAFESDNHSFNISERDVRKTPEPGMMFGLVAIGASVWAKRKQCG